MDQSYKALPEHTHWLSFRLSEPTAPGACLRLSWPTAKRPREWGWGPCLRLSWPQARLSGPRAKRPEPWLRRGTPCRDPQGRRTRSVAPDALLRASGSFALRLGRVRCEVRVVLLRVQAYVHVRPEAYRAQAGYALKPPHDTPVEKDSAHDAASAYAMTYRLREYGAGDFSPAPYPLLRGLARRSGRPLRSGTLVALLLRSGVRFRVALLEESKRIACLLLREYPRASLCGSRTRVRLAQMRADDLTRNAQRSSEILGPVRLCVCHCNHLLSFTRCRYSVARDTLRAQGQYVTLAFGLGVRTFVRVRSVCIGATRAYALHRYAIASRSVRRCIGNAYATTPPMRPPHCPRDDSVAARAERSELAANFSAKSTNLRMRAVTT